MINLQHLVSRRLCDVRTEQFNRNWGKRKKVDREYRKPKSRTIEKLAELFLPLNLPWFIQLDHELIFQIRKTKSMNIKYGYHSSDIDSQSL